MKILLITDAQCPESVRFYRTEGIIPGMPILIDKLSVQECLSDTSWAWGRYQAIWLQQYHKPEHLAIAQIAKQFSLKVILDDDDLRINIPLHNTASRYYALKETRQRIEAMLGTFADLIFLSTQHLKKQYKAITAKPMVVVENAFNPALPVAEIAIRDKSAQPLIAWRGSMKHTGDLETVRQPLMRAYQSQKARWMFIGATPGYLPPQHQEQLPFMPLHQYFGLLKQINIDYLFIPLIVDDFNKAKSNCSAIEALMLAGAIPIAPYGLPEFQHTGVLHYKNNEDLSKLFDKIFKKEIDREVLLTAGQRSIFDHKHLDKMNAVRYQALANLLLESQK